MPSFEFTILIGGVDLLSERSQEAIDEHIDQFVDEAPLAATYSRDGATQRAIFNLEAPRYDAAVRIATHALQAALPAIEVLSAMPGRLPGGVDIL